MQAGQHVLIACSGGPDSTALLHVLHALRQELGVTLCVASIDHGLRPEAASEVQGVCDFAASLGVPAVGLRVSVADGASLQAQARDARYAALHAESRRQGAHRIALGHTADDQAETVLARLLRGSGLMSLDAIAPKRKDGVVRPLIDVSRATVIEYLHYHRLPYLQDPSNHLRNFERVRLRNEIIPLLLKEDPRFVEHSCELADEARLLRETIHEQIIDDVALGQPQLSLTTLQAHARIAWPTFLSEWICRHTGAYPKRRHIEAILGLMDRNGEVRLSDTWSVTREGNSLILGVPSKTLLHGK